MNTIEIFACKMEFRLVSFCKNDFNILGNVEVIKSIKLRKKVFSRWIEM